MAVGSTYPAEILNGDGTRITLNGEITYTDTTTQPLAPSEAIVTVQAGAPNPIGTFTTFLVFDSTASTGGLYAWDGTQYHKVGLATS